MTAPRIRLHAGGWAAAWRQLIADSDMLFDRNWLRRLRAVVPWSAGALSLYNSANHKPTHCSDGRLCTKSVVGCAGAVFCRPVVEAFLAELTAHPDAQGGCRND